MCVCIYDIYLYVGVCTWYMWYIYIYIYIYGREVIITWESHCQMYWYCSARQYLSTFLSNEFVDPLDFPYDNFCIHIYIYIYICVCVCVCVCVQNIFFKTYLMKFHLILSLISSGLRMIRLTPDEQNSRRYRIFSQYFRPHFLRNDHWRVVRIYIKSRRNNLEKGNLRKRTLLKVREKISGKMS